MLSVAIHLLFGFDVGQGHRVEFAQAFATYPLKSGARFLVVTSVLTRIHFFHSSFEKDCICTPALVSAAAVSAFPGVDRLVFVAAECL